MAGRRDAADGVKELDTAFAEAVRGTGASAGALFLLAADEQVLCLEALCGAPAEFAAPWVRVPVATLAHFVLTLWPVGDRYRTLTALAPQDLGPDRTSGLLAPARETAAGILAEGQRQGVFHTVVPAGPLSGAIESHLLALLGTVTAGTWTDDGTSAAVAALIAAGVDTDTAAATVHRARRPDRPH